MIHIDFGTRDLIGVRFAYSPLLEATMSYHLLAYQKRHAIYDPWVDEARRAMYGMEFPFMDAVILPRYYMADFLTPPPVGPRTDFETELATVLDTPDDIVRDNVNCVINIAGTNEMREYFLAYPSEALYCLMEEMREYWRRAVAHYWPRMKSVLENDVLYRARMLALDGTEAVLHSLDDRIHYAQGVVTLDKKFYYYDETRYQTSQPILYLIPSVFSFGSIHWQVAEPWYPSLMYATRGTGLWHSAPPDNHTALELTLGEARARIFAVLGEPASTGELARRLHLTDGAVSQHLNLLREAGLVESSRSGHRVFHRHSIRGEQLMALFS